tara:strand:+ start:62083 stop:62826 length:744 start_codon:yes stop_codon:yes gene_type:complete
LLAEKVVNDTFEITIPVLNEEKELEKKISILIGFLEDKLSDRYKYSIVIADNGSHDRTREVSEKLIEIYPQLSYLHLTEKGVGRALKASWNRSKAKIVGSMDLDLSTQLKHLSEAFSAMEKKNVDILYGTRLHKDSIIENRSIKREITSRVFNFILQKYLGISISDAMCGFLFLRRKILKDLINRGAQNNEWFFQAELLIISDWYGIDIFELPVHWIDDSSSKVRILNLTIEYLKAMKRLKKNKPIK